MNEYIDKLKSSFQKHADPVNAGGQKSYMKDKFDFFGIKAPIRRDIQKEFLVKSALPVKTILHSLIETLWGLPEREFQYFGMELTKKYARQFSEEDIQLMEFMVIEKSWWDTVDFIAVHLMGSFFLKYPNLRELYVQKWLQSGNMWLQRSALLFQLKYKEKLDTSLLERTIDPLLGSSEFFINKAIGWVLREYSKTNPEWVRVFADRTPLQPLSRKEGLRLLGKSK